MLTSYTTNYIYQTNQNRVFHEIISRKLHYKTFIGSKIQVLIHVRFIPCEFITSLFYLKIWMSLCKKEKICFPSNVEKLVPANYSNNLREAIWILLPNSRETLENWTDMHEMGRVWSSKKGNINPLSWQL